MKYNVTNSIESIDQLFQDTRSLSESTYYPDFFDENYLNEDDVKVAINQAIRQKSKDLFRIWVDKKERHDLIATLLNSNIHSDESIEDWSKRVFPDQKFCIFFNQTEQFNDKPTISISKFLNPILQKVGLTSGGCSMIILIGNYGFTPSGVHQDLNEHTIFHFHLGPGVKELFIWTPENFQNLTGSSAPYHYPEKIVNQTSEHFTLKPYDFLCFPPKHYHVGYSSDFSIGIAIVLSELNNLEFTDEIFKNMGLDAVSLSKKNIYKLPPVCMDNDSSSFKDLPYIPITEDIKTKTLDELIKDQLEDFYLRAQSNLGFQPPLFLQNTIENFRNQKIKLIEPFKILYKNNNEQKISIYMRGRKLFSRYYSNLLPLIETINLGKVFEVDYLIQRYPSEFKEDLTPQFIQQAIEHKVIEILV